MLRQSHIVQAAREEASRWIGDAVAYRRANPLVFYLYHRIRAQQLRSAGRHGLARIHRILRRHYRARALASEQAGECASAIACMEDLR